jgi:hypothetical protein
MDSDSDMLEMERWPDFQIILWRLRSVILKLNLFPHVIKGHGGMGAELHRCKSHNLSGFDSRRSLSSFRVGLEAARWFHNFEGGPTDEQNFPGQVLGNEIKKWVKLCSLTKVFVINGEALRVATDRSFTVSYLHEGCQTQTFRISRKNQRTCAI